MNHVAVIGAGIIGSAWAILFARRGIKVSLQDTSEAQRARVPALLQEMLLSSASLIPAGETPASVLGRIQLCATLEEAVENAAYVQEAIVESIPAKQAVFSALDGLCDKEVILASSSSTYGVSHYAGGLTHRRRCVVAHPMTPPHLMPIVEVVPAAFTEPEVVQRTMDFMRRIGQVPVLIKKETDSFVLNRLQGAMLLEMFKVLDEGLISVPDVDNVVRHGLGLRWATLGPLQGIDLNAPKGIGDYLNRYGHIFDDMAKGRGEEKAVSPELTALLDTALRQQISLDSLERRRAWRDKAISGIRETLEKLPGELA